MHIWHPPHDAPHLLEWWRPLLLVSRRARLERVPWPVHVDEFRLAGRVVRSGRPDVWLYEHHENGGTLCVDRTGATYRFVFTPNGRGPGQFRACSLRSAIHRAGLHEVVEPVRYGPLPAGSLPALPEPPHHGGASDGDTAGDAAGAPLAGDPGRALAGSPGDPPADGPVRADRARAAHPAGRGRSRRARTVRRGHLTLVAG
ncbi:MAG TPA: hypothetical protein VFZ68_04865 [Acidimicrobiales bacterium]